MKPTKKRTIRRRLLAMALAAATAFSLAACGNSSGGETEKKEWVWVPEFVTIEDETVSYYDMQLVGDALCYQSYDYDEETGESTQSICKYALADGSITKTPLSYAEEKNWNLNREYLLAIGIELAQERLGLGVVLIIDIGDAVHAAVLGKGHAVQVPVLLLCVR